MTMHSCKGLEFSTVIIPGVGYLPTHYVNPEDDARLLYVAMTRSTDRLIMSYHQESDFVRRLSSVSVPQKGFRLDRLEPLIANQGNIFHSNRFKGTSLLSFDFQIKIPIVEEIV
jgi:ATP-dependent exoDNAse (exonuclease V) beta subunit